MPQGPWAWWCVLIATRLILSLTWVGSSADWCDQWEQNDLRQAWEDFEPADVSQESKLILRCIWHGSWACWCVLMATRPILGLTWVGSWLSLRSAPMVKKWSWVTWVGSLAYWYVIKPTKLIIEHFLSSILSLLASPKGSKKLTLRLIWVWLEAVFRIRIRIGSDFNHVSGSGSRRAKMTHNSNKK